MLYQAILKLGHHEGECDKGFFIFNNANNLKNCQLRKIHELKMMNQQQIICAKLMPWLNDWIFIFGIFHDLTSLNFHHRLKRDVYKSKISFKSDSRTHEENVLSFVGVL